MYKLIAKDVDKLNLALPKDVAFKTRYYGNGEVEIILKDSTGIRNTSKIYIENEYMNWIDKYMYDNYRAQVFWNNGNVFHLE